jgi:hypothetical protein
MERRSREENDIGAGIVPPCPARIAGRLRAGHTSLDCNSIACFPFCYAFTHFHNFTGRFMTRATFIGYNHGVADSTVLPEMNIAPADTGCADMEKNLARARLRSRFLYEVDFVRGIVERSDIGTGSGFLSKLQNSEFRMIQDLPGTIDLRVSNFCLCCRHLVHLNLSS